MRSHSQDVEGGWREWRNGAGSSDPPPNPRRQELRLVLSSFCQPGFPGGSAGEESACDAGDLGAIPGLGRSPGEGNSYPLQYSSLENRMDCIVHRVAKSRI